MTIPQQTPSGAGNRAGAKTRVAVVSPHPVESQALVALICKVRGMIGSKHPDLESFMEALLRGRPELVLLCGVLNEGEMVDTIRSLIAADRGLTVLVMGVVQDAGHAKAALRCGARGYISSRESWKTLLAALRLVLAGEIYLPERINSLMLSQIVAAPRARAADAPRELLSARELDVFRLLGDGHGCSAIAQKIMLSVKTVETYRFRIRQKLDLKDASELRRAALTWVRAHEM